MIAPGTVTEVGSGEPRHCGADHLSRNGMHVTELITELLNGEAI